VPLGVSNDPPVFTAFMRAKLYGNAVVRQFCALG
jgi:hypothetical protein